MSKVPDAVAKVLGLVMKMAELVHKGPCGLKQEGKTVKAYWTVYQEHDLILNFEFDAEDDLKVWDQVKNTLPKSEYDYLVKQVGKCFDYGAIKQQMSSLE